MTALPAGRKQWLFICSKSPWSAAAAAAADLLMTAAVFEQDVSVLFQGEGVLQLLPDQDGSQLGQKTLAKVFPALELYEVRRIYVAADALRAHGLDSKALLLPVEPLEQAALRDLLAASDTVYVF